MSECTCPVSGWCERAKRKMVGRLHMLCQTSEDYREVFHRTAETKQHTAPKQRELEQKRIARSRELWTELHTKQDATPEWLEAWLNRVPNYGCGCRKKAKELIAENPPDFARFFEWTVELHNLVNEQLGKPAVTPDEARAIWA